MFEKIMPEKKKTSSLFPMQRGRTSQVHIGGVSRAFHR